VSVVVDLVVAVLLNWLLEQLEQQWVLADQHL
jgi:hypothetical protein